MRLLANNYIISMHYSSVARPNISRTSVNFNYFFTVQAPSKSMGHSRILRSGRIGFLYSHLVIILGPKGMFTPISPVELSFIDVARARPFDRLILLNRIVG